jgi:hypothetical protein
MALNPKRLNRRASPNTWECDCANYVLDKALMQTYCRLSARTQKQREVDFDLLAGHPVLRCQQHEMKADELPCVLNIWPYSEAMVCRAFICTKCSRHRWYVPYQVSIVTSSNHSLGQYLDS